MISGGKLQVHSKSEFIAGAAAAKEFFTQEYPTVKEILQKEYPHGHPEFIPMCIKEMELHSKKNYDYAKGGNPLGNFERVSKILALYPGLVPGSPEVVAIIYMLKQADAALWMISNKYNGGVEGIDDRLADVHVYAKIIRLILQDQKKEG